MRRFACFLASLALAFSGAHACEHGSPNAQANAPMSAESPDCPHGMSAVDDGSDDTLSHGATKGGFCNGDCNGCMLASAAIVTEPLTVNFEVLRAAALPASERILGRDIAVDPPPPRA